MDTRLCARYVLPGCILQTIAEYQFPSILGYDRSATVTTWKYAKNLHRLPNRYHDSSKTLKEDIDKILTYSGIRLLKVHDGVRMEPLEFRKGCHVARLAVELKGCMQQQRK